MDEDADLFGDLDVAAPGAATSRFYSADKNPATPRFYAAEKKNSINSDDPVAAYADPQLPDRPERKWTPDGSFKKSDAYGPPRSKGRVGSGVWCSSVV